MSPRNWFLAVVLGFQGVLLVVIWWPSSGTVPPEPLIPEISLAAMTRMTVTGADEQSIVVAKSSQGWIILETDDFPASEDKLNNFLDQVASFTSAQPVTQTPASHRRLKVAKSDFTYLLEFQLANGETHRLFIGTSPRYGEAHVRLDGRDTVYRVTLVTPAIGSNATAWVDSTYFSVPKGQVIGLAIQNRAGELRLIKRPDVGWVLEDLAEGESMAEGRVSILLNGVSSIRLTRPLGKTETEEYGLGNPVAVVSVTTRDAAGQLNTSLLSVGAQYSDTNIYFAKASTSPYYVLTAATSLNVFLDKPRDYFLEQAKISAAS